MVVTSMLKLQSGLRPLRLDIVKIVKALRLENQLTGCADLYIYSVLNSFDHEVL